MWQHWLKTHYAQTSQICILFWYHGGCRCIFGDSFENTWSPRFQVILCCLLSDVRLLDPDVRMQLCQPHCTVFTVQKSSHASCCWDDECCWWWGYACVSAVIVFAKDLFYSRSIFWTKVLSSTLSDKFVGANLSKRWNYFVCTWDFILRIVE